MALAVIWTGMVVTALVFGICNGSAEAVGAAALEGAGKAIELGIALCGATCLWCGVMEVMRAGGLAAGLARLLRPVLGRLFPGHRRDAAAMEALSANVSANLLGLGNAATPFGLAAARRMRTGPVATDSLCRLVVINTASLQLIPATVTAVRAAAGARAPFDILPAVWLTSAAALAAGLLAAAVLRRIWRAAE